MIIRELPRTLLRLSFVPLHRNEVCRIGQEIEVSFAPTMRKTGCGGGSGILAWSDK